MEAKGQCPVCKESFTLEIEDPEESSQTYECECKARLDVSYTVTAKVDDIEVINLDLEYECPRCGDAGSLEISEESGEEEVECCDVRLSVSWSDWGRRTTIEIDGATIEYECSECGEPSTLEVSTESGEEEVECDCGATLSVSWSGWGESVKVFATLVVV